MHNWCTSLKDQQQKEQPLGRQLLHELLKRLTFYRRDSVDTLDHQVLFQPELYSVAMLQVHLQKAAPFQRQCFLFAVLESQQSQIETHQ